MDFSSDKELTDFLSHVYKTWMDYSTKLTILDIAILNNIARAYDADKGCGIKEIAADLNINMPTVCKSLKRWSGDNGLLEKIRCQKDKRRIYYIPNSFWISEKENEFIMFSKSLK